MKQMSFEKAFCFFFAQLPELTLFFEVNGKGTKTIYGWRSNVLTLYTSTPQNDQTHSNNSSATVEELFECIWPFLGVGV